MSRDLRSQGGAGGIRANVDDMRKTADVLDHLGDTAGRVASQSRGTVASGALLRTTVFSPVTAARAEGSLVSAMASTTRLQIGIEAQRLVLLARATLFEIADGAGNVLERTAKVVASPFVLAGVIVTGLAGAIGGGAREAGKIGVQLLKGELALSDLDTALGRIKSAAGAGAASAVSRLFSTFPVITDVLTGGLPTYFSPGPNQSGHPGDLEDVIAMITGIAGGAGLFRDGPVRVSGDPKAGTSVTSLEDLISDIDQLTASSVDDASSSAITVVKAPGEPDRWIVQIPGTQEWDAIAAGDPSDLTSNVHLMQRQGELLQAIREAMNAAGVQRGEPVMMAGHSQGGIAAAAFAADPAMRARYTITHVVTAGSPIAHIPVPKDVHVLSLEHDQDPVHRLDGDENPDRHNWTTISRDVAEESDHDPIKAHGAGRYAETAGLVQDDPAYQADLQSFQQFFSEASTSQTYPVSRS